VIGYATKGERITKNRIEIKTVLSDTWKKFASTSVELAMKSMPRSASIATPAAVRLGRLLGRSRRLCSSLSFVNRRSIAGHAKAILKMIPGKMTAGIKTSNGIV